MRSVAVMLLIGCGGGDPPNAQSFDVDPGEISEGDSVELTILATDPQGVDDIAKVTIVDVTTGDTLTEISGPPADDGTFTATVSWDDFVALGDLDFLGEQDRDLEATLVDADGNASGVITATVTLTCPGNGGTAKGDKCFHVENQTQTTVVQTCDDVCTAAGFTCAETQALNAFGEVGNISFSTEAPSGTVFDFTLALPTCDAVGNDQVFEMEGQTYTLDSGSVADWVCYCRT